MIIIITIIITIDAFYFAKLIKIKEPNIRKKHNEVLKRKRTADVEFILN